MESRVYAEDPSRGFLPSTGRLVKYQPPREGIADGITVRNDTGVYEGGEISIFYDPMIAKLVTHAPTRIAAIEAQAKALDSFYIDGIRHNIPFLSSLMQHERWRSGNISTGFIKEEYPEGFSPLVASGETARRIAAIAAAIDHVMNARKREITGQIRSQRAVTFQEQRTIVLQDQYFDVTMSSGVDDFTVEFENGTSLRLTSDWVPGDLVWAGSVEGAELAVQVRQIFNGINLNHAGVSVNVQVYTRREAELARLMPEKVPADTSKALLCPMPGLVKALFVQQGQEVKAGEQLCMVEAMKMENVLTAERDATVTKINAAVGDSLAVDAVIMEFS